MLRAIASTVVHAEHLLLNICIQYLCFIKEINVDFNEDYDYIIDAVGSSRILIGKQKLGRTFNSDKLGGIDFTKISKLTMCSA